MVFCLNLNKYKTITTPNSDFYLDENRGTIVIQGKEIQLSGKLYKLMECLAARRGCIITQAEIKEKVWGEDRALDEKWRAVGGR